MKLINKHLTTSSTRSAIESLSANPSSNFREINKGLLALADLLDPSKKSIINVYLSTHGPDNEYKKGFDYYFVEFNVNGIYNTLYLGRVENDNKTK